MNSLIAEGAMLVQPFQDNILSIGEDTLMLFAGRACIRRVPSAAAIRSRGHGARQLQAPRHHGTGTHRAGTLTALSSACRRTLCGWRHRESGLGWSLKLPDQSN